MAGNNLVNADFSPYSRMFFAVKHIYLTLYIVYICRVTPIYSVPVPARSAVHVLRPDRFQPLAVRAARSAVHCVHLSAVRAAAWPCSLRSPLPCCSLRSPARARACVRVLACARLCVRLLMPGQRWTFLSAVSVWPALLARFPCACGRARARVCVGAVRLPSSRLPCILFAYNVHSPPLCQACPPRFRPAANFFEIVFKLSISVQLSSAGMGDAS